MTEDGRATGRPQSSNYYRLEDNQSISAPCAKSTIYCHIVSQDCLPTSCKVSKEANVAIAKVRSKFLSCEKVSFELLKRRSIFQAASVFVLYATSSANSVAQKSNRYSLTSSEVEYDLALNVECNVGLKENHHGIRCGECYDRHGV